MPAHVAGSGLPGLDHHGGWTIFLGRFVGFARPLAPFAAGAAGMRYRLFLLSNVAGAVVWGTAAVLAGYFLGPAVERSLRVGGIGLAVVIGLAVLGVVMWRRRRRPALHPRLGDPVGDRGTGAPASRLPAPVLR
ncbi:MAG: DedA family protein [Acidimicrobiales bacterium]